MSHTDTELDRIISSIESNAELMDRIIERAKLRNESGVLNERIAIYKEKIRALELKRLVIDSEIEKISARVIWLKEESN